MSELLIDRAKTLVNRYAPLLAEHGIVCTVSRRYFETAVSDHTSGSLMSRIADERREKKQFRGIRNRYRGILVQFSPAEKGFLKQELCKDYVFIVKRIDRAYTGQKPIAVEQDEDEVLARIEKRLQDMLKRARTQDPVTVCKDTWWDACRYVFSAKYNYKHRVFGKDRETIEMIFNIGSGTLVLALAVVVYVLFKK